MPADPYPVDDQSLRLLAPHEVCSNGTPGVSIVVCCHNSESRLRPTLEHLAAQKDACVPWELIVIDNASTDSTCKMAVSCWPEDAPAPLRVVREGKLGLSNARERGFAEAQYEIISFIDDDNWVCSEWVKVVTDVFLSSPDVGLCGGESSPVFEGTPARWFSQFQKCFAVGAQQESAGHLNNGWLWGAGLCVRKSAWQALVDRGFRSVLTGRAGKRLSAGEDTEICMVLSLAGWKQWYEPKLRLQHFIPNSRLQWSYLRGLFRGFGAAGTQLSAYGEAFRTPSMLTTDYWRRTWPWGVASALKRVVLNVRPWLWGGAPSIRGGRKGAGR